MSERLLRQDAKLVSTHFADGGFFIKQYPNLGPIGEGGPGGPTETEFLQPTPLLWQKPDF